MDHVIKMKSTKDRINFWEKAWEKDGAATTLYPGLIRSEDLSGKNVLEIGCGNLMSSYGVYQAKRYVGLDLSANALGRVYDDIPKNTELIHADAVNLPFIDKSFDVVIAVQTISALEDKVYPVLREAARVLNHGGSLIFDIQHTDWCTQDKFKKNVLTLEEVHHGTMFSFKMDGCPEGRYYISYTKEGMQKLLEELELKEDTIEIFDNHEFYYIGIPIYERFVEIERPFVNHTMLVRALRK